MTEKPTADKLMEVANDIDELNQRGTHGVRHMNTLNEAADLLRQLAAEKRKAAEGHLAAQKRDGEGWQPIETAPNDGRRVLLWCKEWSASQSGQWYGMWWGSHALLSGWKYQPTHWMPLPLSPDQDREVSP